MPATTTSSQPMPLAPLNIGIRKRSDSNGMGSPTSLMSSSSSEYPLTTVFTESSQSSGEEPSIATPIAPSIVNEKTVRPHHTQDDTQIFRPRNSMESTRSLRFSDFSRGRHSNSWLFGNMSVRGTIRNKFSKIVTKN